MRNTLCVLTVVGLLGIHSAARAEALVICNVGGPGTTEQARPALEQFLRHVEKAGGLAPGSMTGEYHTTVAGCAAYVQKNHPALGVFDLSTYLKHAAEWKLEPMAHMGKADARRYHVLVREGTFKNLGALAGKTFVTTEDDTTFLSRVILDGKVDAKRAFKLKNTHRPLKGIRNVARGKADATLVGDMARDHLADLQLPVKLQTIYSSPGLPGLTLAVLRANSGGSKATVAKMRKALPSLCTGDGHKLCKTFQVSGFDKANPALYRKLQKQYDAH